MVPVKRMATNAAIPRNVPADRRGCKGDAIAHDGRWELKKPIRRQQRTGDGPSRQAMNIRP
jgi:hypothetical protein